MESSQLKSISIIGLSILCLSPIEYFSNKLFDNKKENKENIIIASHDIKLQPNYLSNNYEIFNPNIKTASQNLEKLASENKKKEISDSENKLESETTNEKIEEESKVVVENKSANAKTSTNNEQPKVQKVQKVEAKATKKTTTVNEKVNSQETVRKETARNSEATNKNVATDLVNFAKQYVGNPYKYGGTNLKTGVDCSGFTMKIYEHFGYSLPHSSTGQSKLGQYASLDNLKAGDLIFYGYNGSISHVAIYIGNGQIIHATTNSGGIKIANYKIMPIITARRIMN